MSGFKFDFQLDEQELDDEYEYVPPQPSEVDSSPAAQAGPETKRGQSSKACYHIIPDELLDSLPDTISYTPLSHPLLKTPLLRRDLFDARFQLISQRGSSSSSSEQKGKGKEKEPLDHSGTEASSSSTQEAQPGDDSAAADGAGGEDYVDAATDLIPGLYEGGLKTWEGGTDLMEVLAEGLERDRSWLDTVQALEVGCGTALPTAYLLHSILSSPPAPLPPAQPTSAQSPRITLHFQDYNAPVLKLVTLPNLLLAALPFLPPESLRAPEDAPDVESVLVDVNQPGHLHITEEVKLGFRRLLESHGVDLRFTYGHWGGLAKELVDGKGDGQGYGLVMTAETIYAEDSVDDLIEVLRGAYRADVDMGEGKASRSGEGNGAGQIEVQLEDTFGNMSVKDDWVKSLSNGEGVILVAAKVLYFGVGGGLAQFLQTVERQGGWWTGIKEWTKGVGRKVVRLGW